MSGREACAMWAWGLLVMALIVTQIKRTTGGSGLLPGQFGVGAERYQKK